MKSELSCWLEEVVALLPFGAVGNGLRARYWAARLGEFKGGSNIFPGVHFVGCENIRVGQGLAINRNVIVDASQGEITIGDHVAIGPNSVLRAANHVFADPGVPVKEQGHQGGYIHIGEDCWLGASVVVLRNVTIGQGSVIGAGAVVTRDIPPYSIAVGVPAKVVGRRD